MKNKDPHLVRSLEMGAAKDFDQMEARPQEIYDLLQKQKEREKFWKFEADLYLVSTMKQGKGNGHFFSARMRSSDRPEWLRSGPRYSNRSRWMVGMGSSSKQMRPEFIPEERRTKKHRKKRGKKS